ncbi:TIGR01459 family HAD-type hydrolase [Phenylobacterium sp.]|jgi:HAD superfamily hydrolase (TIGR01459 family)|uniref:TIGR01459 family HAD-type hydrolase n=1 Tax=Phenylobacterium sp. TaxID=1871053 RepID=UPI0037841938
MSTAPHLISGLGEIADRYDIVLCDIWGVIHNGRESFPGACAALERFNAGPGVVVLITNAPRPRSEIYRQLAKLQVPQGAYAEVATSGDATRKLLAERAPGPAWRLGPDRDQPLYEGLGLEFAPLEQAAFIACTGPFDDTFETPEHYRERLTAAAARGLPMINANPDIVVQRGDTLIYCGGALAQLYETLGGEVFMAGKPNRAIYDLALANAAEQLGRPVDRARVLCIGDGLGTDIRGANAQGLDVLFVANGIHGAEASDGGRLQPAAVERMLAAEGLHAAFVLSDLVW